MQANELPEDILSAMRTMVAEAQSGKPALPETPVRVANGSAPVAELDLDALLDQVDMAPRAVKLLGRTYQVRRDLTGADCIRFWKLGEENKDVEAFALLVGDEDSKALNAAVEQLPQPKVNRALQEIMEIAGLMVMGRPVGKPQAS